ncbi:MAG TPA: aminopeptidase [Syntrophomonas sp.]|nr:aminopeptidase [Syntrophomonas sp.]
MIEKRNNRPNVWDRGDGKQHAAIHDFSRGYVDFLNQAKTEREAIDYVLQKAQEQGFMSLEAQNSVKSGDKLFVNQKGKLCALIMVGQNMADGFNLVVSHVDTPRLDLKPRPLYEADNMALLKTHYYGGIKKYQWPAIPLALHGVVVKKNGERIKVCIGEKEDDAVLAITDLLPHLAKDQMEKKMNEGIKGEDLNIVVGSCPVQDLKEDAFKQHILNLLQQQYGIEEDDFTSAELQAVPAFKAREVGLDRSMIGAYGQDDRVSAYTALEAVLNMKQPARTAVCLFADKEEIGSTGNTGLQSLALENITAELLSKAGLTDYYQVRKTLAKSYALSADVNAAVDPTFPDVFEKMNCSFVSAGVVLTKYTGSRGKADSNDANPEFVAAIRRLFDEENVVWQVGELGKVDIGGGGTVAQYLARYGMEVVDCGVAVLSMHSPFEIVSKADVYMAYRAYQAFMEKMS